ncbi:MAG: histidine phosphatase family protein [Alphaproteobacteria bacterium]
MRRLLLLRHAKAVPTDLTQPDFDRPLSPKGRKGAAWVAQVLVDARESPELVLCSAALRTRETLARLMGVLAEDATIALERQLYMAPASKLLARVRKIDDSVRSALVIGHNPGLERLASMLAGRGDETLLAAMRTKFPTAGLAVLEIPARSWSKLEPGDAKLVDFVTPGGVSE